MPIEILSQLIDYAISDVSWKKTDHDYRGRARNRGQLVSGNTALILDYVRWTLQEYQKLIACENNLESLWQCYKISTNNK